MKREESNFYFIEDNLIDFIAGMLWYAEKRNDDK